MTDLNLFDTLASPTQEEMADYLVQAREDMIKHCAALRQDEESKPSKRQYVAPDPALWRIQLQALIESGLTDICISYCRVSTVGQEQGFSMEVQRRYCAGWAALNRERGKVDLVVEDVNPGSEEERAGISFLREAFLTGKVAVVICYKLDRIARSQYLAEQINFEAQQNGVEIISATESLPDSGYISDLFRQVLQSFGEYEATVIRERLSAGRRASAILDGIYQGGKPPLGYRSDGGKLLIVESEARIVRLVFLLISRSYTCHAIAEFLNRCKIPLRSEKPGPGWTSSQISSMRSKQAAYRGECVFGSMYKESATVIGHEAILPTTALDNAPANPLMSRVPDAFLTEPPYLERRLGIYGPEHITYDMASVLVMAYKWHVERVHYPEIVKRLNSLNLKSVLGKPWTVGNLRQQCLLRHRWAEAAVKLGVPDAWIVLPEDKADLLARIEMERKAIERIHELYSQNVGCTAITRALAAERYLTMDKREWCVGSVTRVVKGTQRYSQTLLARMEAREVVEEEESHNP